MSTMLPKSLPQTPSRREDSDAPSRLVEIAVKSVRWAGCNRHPSLRFLPLQLSIENKCLARVLIVTLKSLRVSRWIIALAEIHIRRLILIISLITDAAGERASGIARKVGRFLANVKQ